MNAILKFLMRPLQRLGIYVPRQINTENSWLTCHYQCRECVYVQPVHVVEIRRGLPAIVKVVEGHQRHCSRHKHSGKERHFQL